jgi:hypothetical protein
MLLFTTFLLISGCDTSSNYQVGTTASTTDNAIQCESEASLGYVHDYRRHQHSKQGSSMAERRTEWMHHD